MQLKVDTKIEAANNSSMFGALFGFFRYNNANPEKQIASPKNLLNNSHIDV